jgi:spermidine synthase
MLRTLSATALGVCVFGTAYAAQRLIAPYAGLSLALYCGIAFTTLLGFAIGCAFGARTASAAGALLAAARALLVAAVLTLLTALFHRPLLVALWGVDLRLTIAVASVGFAGLPILCLGFAFGAGAAEATASEALGHGAWLIGGAAIAAPLAGYGLVPQLGLTITLAILAAGEGALAFALGFRRSPTTISAGALLVLAAALFVGVRPAGASRLGPQMLEFRRGHEGDLRVFDRNGARYLVADGTIHAVMDTLSGDNVQRGPAALGLLRLMRPGRDSMLVLGLRGGTLPLAFARSGWRVRVIEPDAERVRVSQRVSYRPGEVPLDVVDIRRFLRKDRGRHSVIVLDAFADSYMPFPLCTRECVDLVAPRLLDDGMLVVSVETLGWDDPMLASLAATLRTRFPHVVALPTSEPPNAVGTILLLATKQPVAFTDDQLPDPTQFFQNPDALWVAQQQTHAWLNRFEPQPANAPVLTDDRSMIEVWSDRLNRAERAELHGFFGPYGGSW